MVLLVSPGDMSVIENGHSRRCRHHGNCEPHLGQRRMSNKGSAQACDGDCVMSASHPDVSPAMCLPTPLEALGPHRTLKLQMNVPLAKRPRAGYFAVDVRSIHTVASVSEMLSCNANAVFTTRPGRPLEMKEPWAMAVKSCDQPRRLG